MTTTYRGYAQPTVGGTGWDTDWNNNWSAMDADLGRGYTPAGLDASKPASPTVGDTYLATDTGVFYKCLVDGVWTGTISAAEIPAASIGGSHIVSGAVTSAKLAANAATAAKIAAGAVTSAALAAGAVDQYRLADAAITAAKLASGAVTADKFAAGAVDTAALADSAVTADKIPYTYSYSSTTSGLATIKTWDTTLFRLWRLTWWGDYITCPSTNRDDWREITELTISGMETSGGVLFAAMTFFTYAKDYEGIFRFAVDGTLMDTDVYAGRTIRVWATNCTAFQVITGVPAGAHTFAPAWALDTSADVSASQKPTIATYDTNISIPVVLIVLEMKR